MRWAGRTAFILASGPSLSEHVVRVAVNNYVAGRFIAVNESWRRLPSADVLYGADMNWWMNRAPEREAFKGERWTQDKQWDQRKLPADMHVIPSKAGKGVAEPGSGFVYTGHNSSFQAMGLAILWGVRRIIFLGLDCQAVAGESHWHGDHVKPLVNTTSAFPVFIRCFEDAAPKVAALGVEVINASPRSALTCFPRMTIEEALR